jgi:opacity protein-like surface antigen
MKASLTTRSISIAALLAAASAATPAGHGFYAGASWSDISARIADRPVLAIGVPTPPDPAAVHYATSLALFGQPAIGDSGYKVMADYRVMDWLAFEADYADLGDTRRPLDFVCVVGPCPNAVVGDASSASVSALGLVPIGKLDLFVRAGISHWRTHAAVRAGDQTVGSASDSDTEATYGAGVQYQVKRVLARLEVQRLRLGPDRADVTSLGFAWAF